MALPAVGEEIDAPQAQVVPIGGEVDAPGGAPVALGQEIDAPAPAEPQGILASQVAHQPAPALAAAHRPMTPAEGEQARKEGDQELLGRYTAWSMARKQGDPELQARVLRVATALRETPGAPQPDFFYLRDHIDEFEAAQAGRDWEDLARRHPALAKYGLDPKVSPLLVDDSAQLGILGQLVGGWDAPRDPGNPFHPSGKWDRSSPVDLLGLPRLRTAPAWAKYARDGALAVGRALLTAERAAGIAMPDLVEDPSSPVGVRVTTEEEAVARRDATIEAMRTVPTAYASSKAGQVAGGLVSMSSMIAGDVTARSAGAAAGGALGVLTGPAAPAMVPLLAAAGSWAGSWLFNTAFTVGDLQEQMAQVDDGTGQPLGMERARPLAWAAAQVQASVFATGFGRAARATPFAGPVLRSLEHRAVVQALSRPTVLKVLARQGALYGAHVVEGTATMAAAAAVSLSAVELTRARYGGEADWERVGKGIAETAERAALDMAILTAWGPARAAVRETALLRRYGTDQVQLAAMRAAARDSKLFGRSEAEGEAAADALLQDLPQAPKAVYADVTRWDAEAKARGQDPRQMAADLIGDGGKAYDLAKASSGDLAIPTAKALVKVLRTELGDALAQDLKLDPGGLTVRQAVTERARLVGRMRELASRGADQLEGDARAVYDAEKAKALGALMGTRAEKDAEKVADNHARLEAAQAVVLAERYGGTAAEWYDRMGAARTTLLGPEGKPAAPAADPGLAATGGRARRGEFRVVLDGAGEEAYSVQLFAAADRSTLAHETAHRFAHTLGRVASAEGAPEGLKADYQAVLATMGFGGHAERMAARTERIGLANQKTRTPEEQVRLDQLVAKEERLSHLWELYLSTGKAPTAELASVFRRFKNWMTSAYKALGGVAGQFGARFPAEPRLELTPEVRGVFDRLLATDEELAIAERAAGGRPSDAARERMTPEEQAIHDQTAAGARRAAEEALTARIAAADLKEDAAWFREERARLEAEVTAELEATPAYRALAVLQDGTAPGLPEGTAELLKGPDGAPPKLDRADLVSEYGADLVRTLPRGIFAEKGKTGRSADDLAVVLGFESGEALVRALQAAEPKEHVAAREAKVRLEELYGPSLLENRDALAGAALEAVHTPEAMKASIRAMGAMARRLGPAAVARVQMLSPEMLRAYAHRMLAGRPMTQLSPATFLRSERAAADRARDAYKAGNDALGLLEDEARLVNQALYGAAVELREQVQKHEAKARQATGDAWRTALGKAGSDGPDGVFRSSWRDASDGLLQAVGLGRPPAPGQIRVGFDAMVAEAEQIGASLAFDLDGVRELLQTPRTWAELTPEQAELVAAAVTNIRQVANLSNEFKLLDRTLTKDDIVQQMREKAAASRPPQPRGKGDRGLNGLAWEAGQAVRAFDGMLLETESMVDMIAGGDRDSVFHAVFVDGFLAARNQKEQLATKYLEGIIQSFDKLPKERRRRLFEEVDISADLPVDPALQKAAGLDWSRVQRSWLMMVALNMGNAGNKQRLLDGYGWTEDQVVAALGKHLTRPELEFSQEVINSLEGLWPQLAQLHERETGLPPGKIQAKRWEVELANGDVVYLAGGYFPAKYDPRPGTSQRGEAAQERAVQGMLAPNSVRAATAKSHTQERAIRVEDVVDLSWGVVPQHVNQVLHDLAFRSYVRQTAALIADPRVEAVIVEHLGPERWRQFEPWLQAVAHGAAAGVPANERTVNSVFQALRGRATVKALGHSLANVAGDISNPLVALAAGEVSLKQLSIATGKMALHPFKTMEWARSLSPELRFRAEKSTQHLQVELGAMAGQAGRTNPTLRAIRETAFWAQEQADKATATPVWIARFNGELAKGASQAEAVRTADAAVRHVFPAETAAEKAAIFRSRFGNWLVFYGYMNKLYQVNRGLVDDAYRRSVDPTGTAGKSKAEVLGRLVGVALSAGAVSELLTSRGREPDETWGDWLARKTAASPFQSLPWVGGLTEAGISMAQGGSVSAAKVSVRTAPGMEAGIAFVKNLGRAYEDGLLSEAGVVAAVEAVGFGLNVPTRQLVRTGGYALGGEMARDLENGSFKDVAEGLFYGRRPGQAASVLDAAADVVDAVAEP